MLLSWGRWNRGQSSLDFSRINILHRCIKEGAGASHSTVNAEPHMPKVVEIVENCVLGMPKHVQKAVKIKYIWNWTDRDAAKRCKCGIGEYESRLNQAIHNLVNYLTEN